jgi:hypothetical protein
VKQLAILMMSISSMLIPLICVRTAKDKTECGMWKIAFAVQVVWTLVYYFITFIKE